MPTKLQCYFSVFYSPIFGNGKSHNTMSKPPRTSVIQLLQPLKGVFNAVHLIWYYNPSCSFWSLRIKLLMDQVCSSSIANRFSNPVLCQYSHVFVRNYPGEDCQTSSRSGRGGAYARVCSINCWCKGGRGWKKSRRLSRNTPCLWLILITMLLYFEVDLQRLRSIYFETDQKGERRESVALVPGQLSTQIEVIPNWKINIWTSLHKKKYGLTVIHLMVRTWWMVELLPLDV